jgi:hypothetical protein
MALLAVEWNPDRRQLRSFGLIFAVLCLAAGTWAHFTHALVWIAVPRATALAAANTLWIAAAGVGALAAMAPALLRPLYLLLTAISVPIGFVIGHAVLGAVFFGLITPVALIFRITGRDVLARRIDRGAASYWTLKQPVKNPIRYFRQF